MSSNTGPIIYNLFPRLVGQVQDWKPHIKRAADMGFNWIFINPFHSVGSSKSLYAIKNYYDYNPLFFANSNGYKPKEELKKIIKYANKCGLRVMADLVINHTSVQSPLVDEHPEWYKTDKKGKLVNPGAMDNGKMHYWRDLAEIDNSDSSDRDELWKYWFDLLQHYLSLGFSGFRCDAAYQISPDLWAYLIEKIKNIDSSVEFFAETLGCTVEKTLDLVQSGFDYIFNSSKWWDFEENWFLEQHAKTQSVAPSISFPESHDTKRLATETKKNITKAKLRYAFSALITKGVMIPIGFEYGFLKSLNVKNTTPSNWEKGAYDLCEYIKTVNRLKEQYRIFNEETKLQKIKVDNPSILALLKESKDNSERNFLIINKDTKTSQDFALDQLDESVPGNLELQDISPTDSIGSDNYLSLQTQVKLKKSQIKVLYQKVNHI